MPQPKLFRPADALMFRTLPEQFLIIQEMRRRFDHFEALGYASREALYFAYVETHPNKHGVATAVGADEFYRSMTRLLGVAQDMVEYVTERRFWIFHERLAFHNTIANCLDPLNMLKMATQEVRVGADRLSRQLQFEASRQLGIALQLFSIETVDKEAWIPQDLASIERLSWERLFLPEESRNLWIIAQLDSNPKGSGRCTKIQVFTSTKEKSRVHKRMRKRGTHVREDQHPCRIAVIGDQRYYVLAINRRKRLLSTLMKLERGRPYQDRRGWKYVVIAVETRGKIRVATAQDARRFSEHTRHTLWQHPLVQEEDNTSPNPDRHDDYRDEKTVGRFEHRDNGRIVAGVVEQLVTHIQAHVDTLVARNRLNHFLYSSNKVLTHIAPLWFPHRRGPYDQMQSFRLPGYGIDWERPHFRDQLEEWWNSQL